MSWLLAVAALAAGLGGPGCPLPGGLGSVAYVSGSSLRVVSLSDCSDRVLVARGARPPVRFSSSGRFVEFGRGQVVAVGGGTPTRPLGVSAGVWSPTEDLLAGATAHGGVVVARPGGPPRRLLPDGWGAGGIAFAPDGRRLAVTRFKDVWAVDLASGRARLVYRTPRGQVAPPELAGWSPDGRWILFWSDIQNSASLAADGLPLKAVRASGGPVRLVLDSLVASDFLTWCGPRLVAAAGGDRVTTVGKSIVSTAPPAWRATPLSRDRTRSWVSPSCARDGAKIAAAAGPAGDLRRFGEERRGIWLLSPRRRLTTAPMGTSDETPRWSRDGGWILFVRSSVVTENANARGTLELARASGGRPQAVGARPVTGWNYYGHYSWADALDWSERP